MNTVFLTRSNSRTSSSRMFNLNPESVYLCCSTVMPVVDVFVAGTEQDLGT